MNFEELRKTVFTKTPILKKVLSEHGTTPLLQYFEENLYPTAPSRERQNELLEIIKKMIVERIDPLIAEDATEQLRKHYYASTADHHGPITHPFFVNSHLAQALAYKKHQFNSIFVFACGGISLNNSSFPRGIFLHNTKLEKKCLRFISLKNKHHPVFGFPAYTDSELKKRLQNEYELFSNQEIQKIKPLVQEVYQDEQVLHSHSYSDQISRTNYLLWKKIPGQEHVNLIYLEQEDIVNQVLLTHHLNNHTILTRLLTEEKILDAFETYFDGISGAFSSKDDRGTVLFWTIHEGERKQLRRRKNMLESMDGRYQISLTPEHLREAIEKKELMPSMALSFIVLSFYYGLTCGGGFSQVNYLTQMKEAYLRLVKKIKEETEQELVLPIKTDYFCGEFVFARIGNKNRTAHASSIDLILYGDKKTDSRLQELARLCTLGEAIDQMMPNFYKILYGTESGVSIPASMFPPSIYVSQMPLLRQ